MASSRSSQVGASAVGAGEGAAAGVDEATSSVAVGDVAAQTLAPTQPAPSQKFIIGSIKPEPTPQERQAILLALEAVADQIFPPDKPDTAINMQWRFSGRWWNRGSLRKNHAMP